MILLVRWFLVSKNCCSNSLHLIWQPLTTISRKFLPLFTPRKFEDTWNPSKTAATRSGAAKRTPWLFVRCSMMREYIADRPIMKGPTRAWEGSYAWNSCDQIVTVAGHYHSSFAFIPLNFAFWLWCSCIISYYKILFLFEEHHHTPARARQRPRRRASLTPFTMAWFSGGTCTRVPSGRQCMCADFCNITSLLLYHDGCNGAGGYLGPRNKWESTSLGPTPDADGRLRRSLGRWRWGILWVINLHDLQSWQIFFFLSNLTLVWALGLENGINFGTWLCYDQIAQYFLTYL